jgi:hypothetical protein
MKPGLVPLLCRALIVSLMSLSFQSGAAMIGTDQATRPATQSDRVQIQSLLTRAEVANQLQALGVDVKMAQDRVSLMTDDEARTLADTVNSVPAGADGGLVVVIIVLAIFAWWWWYRNLR